MTHSKKKYLIKYMLHNTALKTYRKNLLKQFFGVIIFVHIGNLFYLSISKTYQSFSQNILILFDFSKLNHNNLLSVR